MVDRNQPVMHLDLIDFTAFKDDLSYLIPSDYRRPVLHGAAVQAVSSFTFGALVLQNLQQPSFGIQLTVADVLKSFSLNGFQLTPRLVSLLGLTKNSQFHIRGLGSIFLKQGQYTLLYLNQPSISVSFKKSTSCAWLAIDWSDEIVQQALPYFGWLQKPVRTASDKEALWISKPRAANTRIMDIANDILTNPYNDEIGKLLYENKIREYLLELLIEAGEKPAPKIKLTQLERARIIAIGEEMAANPDKKYPIASLTVKAGMNSIKLKDAFKEIHGRGIFEHQMMARMEEARRLLMETDLSTKQISAMIGYKLTTSFVTRFKKYFGYYSSEVPRNRY